MIGIDFISPYIEKYGLPRNKEDELLIKKRIVHDFKQRIIKKARLMKSNYDQVFTLFILVLKNENGGING